MIYLDNAATTAMSEIAIEEYKKYAQDFFFNPSATYIQSVEISNILNEGREKLKKLLGVKKGDIIFTSGATESNNLAIRGSVREGKWEYVFSAGEHPSVYNIAKEMMREGKIVKFVPLLKSGEVDYFSLSKVFAFLNYIIRKSAGSYGAGRSCSAEGPPRYSLRSSPRTRSALFSARRASRGSFCLRRFSCSVKREDHARKMK